MAYIGTEPKDVRSFGRAKFDYTATQGQTAFTGADDDGKTLGFTDGQMEVFVNGILMDESDFSTSNGNTVTLASAANLNDIISIVAMQTDIPNSDYVPASGGTFTGAVTHSGAFTSQGIDDNANANAITIDSSERVAIGHTSPSASEWNNNAKLLHIKGNDTNGAIVKVSSSNADGVLAVGDNHLQFGTTSDDPVKIYTNSSQRLTVDSDGLKFGTDTAAANALNKYEEGSFTYTMNVGNNGYVGTVQSTYTGTAYYTKIGKFVCVQYPSYNVQADGQAIYSYTLPFTSAYSGAVQIGECRGAQMRYGGTSINQTISGPYGYFSANDTIITFLFTDAAQDFSGYIYYPTATGSQFPIVTATYRTTT